MRLKRQIRIAMRANVVDLLHDHRARRFHLVGNCLKMRNHRIGFMGQIAPRQNPGAVRGHRFGHDHPGPAQRAFQPIGPLAGQWQPPFGHVVGMGAKDDPVAQGLAAQGDGRQKAGMLGHVGSFG